MSTREAKQWLQQVSDHIERLLQRLVRGATITGGRAFQENGAMGATFEFSKPIRPESAAALGKQVQSATNDYTVEVTTRQIKLTPCLAAHLFTNAIEGSYVDVTTPKTQPQRPVRRRTAIRRANSRRSPYSR